MAALPLQGLTESEAQARLKAEGYNEQPQAGRRTPLRIAMEVLKEPMLAMLLGGGIVYLAIGELADALILMIFAMMSIVITVTQEIRTERVLEALRDLASPRALVIRDGERKRIAGREVARGDTVVLSEGDRVPADMSLLDCHELQIDESLLTGESVPVRKIDTATAYTGEPPRPGGDDTPFAFSGTLVVRGDGIGEVIATGRRSEMGKIGASLADLKTVPPKLQLQTRRLVRIFALLGAVVSLAAVVLYGLSQGSWPDAMLAGIALGMSMLPEEFPVVLAVFMAMGAWRISKARVLTRRAAAIETLGSATVLCTDKTGTLTENRMSIVELRLADGLVLKVGEHPQPRFSAEFARLLRTGVLASAQVPVDPMDRAFHALESQCSPETAEPISKAESLVHMYGLRPGLLAVSQVWKTDADDRLVVAAKGAPEAILRLCRTSARRTAEVKRSIDAMARQGIRVLGIARATTKTQKLPNSPEAFKFEFLGLAGLADPLREAVPRAVSQCQSAGIRVIMITGDYAATAAAIAREARLDGDTVITGDQIRQMDDAALARQLEHVNVFARIMPEQKLRIVEALKGRGHIVAMTGDGVNDAPSLKAAHIGVAMGGRGTDVAREASAMVLLDDDFSSIVAAVRLGRRIYDNLRKVMGFIVAVHVPIAGLALLPLVLGLPVMFSPIHIAFLEMVIDPVCSLVFEAEAEEEDIMQRPPRPPDEPLFSRQMIGWSIIQGLLGFTLVGCIFVMAHWWGMPQAEVRALSFFSLVTVILGLIFVNRTFDSSVIDALSRPNPSLGWVLLAVVAILSLSLLWPAASDLFRFGPLHLDDLALTITAGAAVLVVLEFLKPIWRRQFRSQGR